MFVCAINYWETLDAMTLNCSMDIFPFHLVGVVYRCSGTIVFDAENNDTITAVHATHHFNDQENMDVQGLIISSQGMEYFPMNIGSIFPDLKVINFPLNFISSVTNKHLIPFPGLEFLALFGNRIESLDSDIFSGLNALKFINLGRNRIKHVGQNIFLPGTAHVYLYSNSCIDRDAVTKLELTHLRFSLLMNCPPSEVQHTNMTTSLKMRNKEKQILKIQYLQLAMRVSFLEAIVDATRCLNIEDPSV